MKALESVVLFLASQHSCDTEQKLTLMQISIGNILCGPREENVFHSRGRIN